MSLLSFTAGNVILLSVLVFNFVESPFTSEHNHRKSKIKRSFHTKKRDCEVVCGKHHRTHSKINKEK